jgi:glycosyltransferase involved in cell wall biosynthesis
LNNQDKRVLFISHDTSRTGAPIVLLNMADLLKGDNYRTDFLLRSPGPLEKDFKLRGKTFIANKNNPETLLKRLKNKLFRPEKFDFKNIKWQDYHFVISNTITNGDILSEVKKHFNGPIFSYVHELEMGSKFYTTPANLKEVIKHSNGYLTASEGIKKHLINNFMISESKIASIPCYIPSFKKPAFTTPGRKNSFTIGAAGTIDWRKGPEIFILIAKKVFEKRPNTDISFVWRGAASEIDLDRLNYDILKLDLKGSVSFKDPSDDMQSFYSEIDLFFSTSREDPYPLVVLEAADMSIPSICFDNAGGAQEFIKTSRGGSVISYLDINASANEILLYYDDGDLCRNSGANAKKWLGSTHQNAEFVKHKIDEALQKLLSAQPLRNRQH